MNSQRNGGPVCRFLKSRSFNPLRLIPVASDRYNELRVVGPIGGSAGAELR